MLKSTDKANQPYLVGTNARTIRLVIMNLVPGLVLESYQKRDEASRGEFPVLATELFSECVPEDRQVMCRVELDAETPAAECSYKQQLS